MLTARKTREQTLSAARGIGTLAVMLVVLVPILWIILTAFKPLENVYTMDLIFSPTLENFAVVFGEPFYLGERLMNSIIVSVGTVAIGLPVALAAAYGFSRFRFRGQGAIYFGILVTQFVPSITIILPFFLFFRQLGLIDTLVGLIWVNLSLVLPFAIWLLKGFVDAIPIEMEEAAMVDGATPRQIIFDIVIPVCVPGLFVAGIFCFLFSWNDFLFPLILTRSEAVTLPVTLSSFYTEEGVRWELIAATGTLILAPVFVVSFFIQKHFVYGTTSGSDR